MYPYLLRHWQQQLCLNCLDVLKISVGIDVGSSTPRPARRVGIDVGSSTPRPARRVGRVKYS